MLEFIRKVFRRNVIFKVILLCENRNLLERIVVGERGKVMGKVIGNVYKIR